MRRAAWALAIVLSASPAYAQLGALGKLTKAKQIADVKISDRDERQIGERVSQRLCNDFGVVQDAAVAKYVALVGTVLAQASTRPSLQWEFIVLDTDGVNAFAAPGGIIHITRGALGLIKTEAELAGVLGHEITHVTEKHTIESIQKSKLVGLGADQVGGGLTQDLISRFAEQAYKAVLNNQFDRDDENEADRVGVQLANKAGYAPDGLSSVLVKIAERNSGQKEPNGMFASHPLIKDRIAKIADTIKAGKLTSTATVNARYTTTIAFEAKPLTAIATVAEGARGLAGGSGGESAEKKEGEKAEKTEGDTAAKPEGDTAEEPKKKGGLLGRLKLTGGQQSQSSQTVASAGARGVNPDRDAVGGPNKNKVQVKLTPEEIAAFKQGIA